MSGWMKQTARKDEPGTPGEANGDVHHMENVSNRSPSSGDDPEAMNGLHHVETFQTTYDQGFEIYRDGQLVLLPAASRDPNDPMNLSMFRKVLALFFVSFFGALIASAEIILGACLPVFALQYADIPGDPNPGRFIETVQAAGLLHVGVNPLKVLEDFLAQTTGPSIFDIYLLAALPLLIIGVANWILVPFAIAFGRRPVLIVTGCIAIGGACWAGASTSWGSHLGARCIQAVGAGTVESLIPFIIQDMVHVHQRNTWISAAFAAQGVIIIAVGYSTPYIIIHLSWHWVYYITAAAGGGFMAGVILFLPETRFPRTRSEMDGIPRKDEHIDYEPRSYVKDLYLWRGKMEPMKGVRAFWMTMKTFFYPQIFFVTMLNGVMISSGFAASYTAAPILLTDPWSWPFDHLGFALTAVLIGALFVGLIQGRLADFTANFLARKTGRRIPENQLINLILPVLCGIIGCILFGLAGNDQKAYSWPTFLTSIAFLAFGFLGTSAISTVYVLECYPYLAGPALVGIASFRFIIAFLLTFEASNWVVDMGFLDTFMIYMSLIAFTGLFIPVVYFFGPRWRKRFGQQVGDT